MATVKSTTIKFTNNLGDNRTGKFNLANPDERDEANFLSNLLESLRLGEAFGYEAFSLLTQESRPKPSPLQAPVVFFIYNGREVFVGRSSSR